jgi:sec-independent protein translocase protein TatC
MMADSFAAENAQSPLLRYLCEARTSLLRCLLAMAIVFVSILPWANQLYACLAKPLLKDLPAGTSLIATAITASFVVPLKLVFIVSFFLTAPVFLHQLWRFIAPALYKRERRWLWPLLFFSTALFYLGMSFAYFLVFPLVFDFFVRTAPQGVAVMPDISQYLDFVLQLFFAFGAAFEIPVVIVLLVKTGLTTIESLANKRPYWIVFAFVLGMLFAPPDVFSQTLLAIPLCALFEIGILIARCLMIRSTHVSDRRCQT